MTTEPGRHRRRGEPIAALALLLTLWTGVRMMLWESPFDSAFSSAVAAPVRFAKVVASHVSATPADAIKQAKPPMHSQARQVVTALLPHHASANPANPANPPKSVLLEVVPHDAPLRLIGPAAQAPFIAAPLAAKPPKGPNRWHLAGWAAWRASSGLPPIASGARPVSYGGTQLGVLASFDLATGGHRPALHVRATYAPDRPRQRDFAAGAGLRPLPRLPLRLLGEVRATRSEGRSEIRPAVFGVTELAPFSLPLGMTADGYAQAGWVGGRYATAFADGQAHLTRAIAGNGAARIKVGAGAWGGAQKHAERFDVGPTVALDLMRGPATVRVALDYRIRVAGNADPGDGVALTLSTGF